MRYLLTSLIICCSFIVNAQSWSIGAAGGTTRWNRLREAHFDDIYARGWNAEIEGRYTPKKARWVFGLALNAGRYSRDLKEYLEYTYSYPYTSGNYTYKPVKLITDVKTYSLRLSAEYLVADFGKSHCPLFKKFSFSTGISIAPVIYRERESKVNPNDYEQVYYKSDRDNSYSLLAGIQGRLSYKLTRRLNVNLSGIIQTDCLRIADKNRDDYRDFRPDACASALLGVSFRL